MLKSVYDDQNELLRAMVGFYSNGSIDLDPTWGSGNFYKKTDLLPVRQGDIAIRGKNRIDATDLRFKSSSLSTIMFDPPFLPGASPKKTGIINQRFGWFRTIRDVWKMYEKSLLEFHRVLAPRGIVYFKCQDVCNSGKQHWSRVWIINKAQEIGFSLEDIFILTAKNRLTDPRWKTQRHARKFHSYFLVLRKR